MFEAVELGRKVSKEDYEREEAELREALLDAQLELGGAKPFAVVALFGGVKGAGKRDLITTLDAWLDPRFVAVHGLREPSEEERERPYFWRFWRRLPPKGRIAFFHGSWYTQSLLDRARGGLGQGRMDRRMERVRRFETLLAKEGALVLKYWLHIPEALQAERLKALEADKLTRWRIRPQDREDAKRYGAFIKAGARAIQHTDTPEAPWVLVDAADPHHARLSVGRHLLAALRARLATAPVKVESVPAKPAEPGNLLRSLDLSQRLEDADYAAELERLQGRLARLTRKKAFAQRSLVLAFEGMDAAGKGGSIRRVMEALDLGRAQVVPVAAPTEEERAQPYLWRFWRQLPRAGSVSIFDRSWYGRVLVERVEGFCPEADWMRAYAEINDFEEQLRRNGTLLLKFWLHISQDEQRRRFEARADTPFKRFKITEEDWRNREKWPLYEAAVLDMVERTSTVDNPWTLVPSEDKRFGRIRVLQAIVDRLEAEL